MKEILIFEWVVFDNCNLKCSYCVNKGEFSHKESSKLLYVPGREVDIAHKIVELSHLAHKVFVNLTGGEPLLANRINEVIAILKTAGNIKVNLISNFSLVEKISGNLTALNSVLVSLHIQHRPKNAIEPLINSINYAKKKVPIHLSQVDYDLSKEARETISNISSKTGLTISFQPFIPPWTEKGKVEKGQEISDATFVSSFGKRCSLGYFNYFILPDGTFYYGLWCDIHGRKTGNFLLPLTENRQAFSSVGMGKCPASSCGCNYNLSCYEEYHAECRRLGYSKREIFGRYNEKTAYTLSRQIIQAPRALFKRARYIITSLKNKYGK